MLRKSYQTNAAYIRKAIDPEAPEKDLVATFEMLDSEKVECDNMIEAIDFELSKL